VSAGIAERMTAPLFFVDSLQVGEVRLSEPDTRHALRSRRIRPGDPVTLADGAGRIGAGRLVGEDASSAVIAVEDVRVVARRGPLVTVALAPPKGGRLTWAIQKLAELGVDEALLLDTERTVRAWSVSRRSRAEDRLGTVAREAAMQARRPFVMEVRGGVGLGEALGNGTDHTVTFWEWATEPLASALPRGPAGIRLLIGPEGGFSEAEVEAARRSGSALVSLGEGVLRTETAAVVGAALVLAHYGRLG
jgi:16S rRNA (uracil1498-N3)-methyltransferase